MRHAVLLGTRWDEPSQTPRTNAAATRGLIDFVEVNYPVAPQDLLPDRARIVVHSSETPIASAYALEEARIRMVSEAARRHMSAWVGEHLCLHGVRGRGTVGYNVNPPLLRLTADAAVRNASLLASRYGTTLALELGPFYGTVGGDYESELHLLADVAERSDSFIILDVAHWYASNVNLGRPEGYGFDALPLERVIELHVAGLRKSHDGTRLHDAHQLLPPDVVTDATLELVRRLPELRAVTFEHDPSAPESDFFDYLERLRSDLSTAPAKEEH